MQKYEVRLQSQTDEQSRVVTLSADTPGEAKRRAELIERKLVAFSLLPKEPAEPKKPDEDAALELWERYEQQHADYANAIEAYPALREEAEGELAKLNELFELDDSGKIVGGPKNRTRANWHAHHQAKPYEVVSVEEHRLGEEHVERLVRELRNLKQDEEAWKALLGRLEDEGTPLAAVTAFMYGTPVLKQYDGTAVVDWDTDTIKVALLTAHTESQDTHDFFNDVVGNEITGTGYTAGGATLGSKAITYDTASDQVRMDAADTTWTTSTLSSTEAVVYKSTGTDSTSPLMAFIDFGGTVSTTAGTFQITWDATGIIIIDVT